MFLAYKIINNNAEEMFDGRSYCKVDVLPQPTSTEQIILVW